MTPIPSLRRIIQTRFGFGRSLLLIGTLPLLSACGDEASRSFSTHSEEELVQLMSTLRPGDSLRYRQVGVLIPPAGEGVHVEAVLADGSTVELQVKTAGDGRVALVRHPEPVKALESADHTALSACNEGDYHLLGWQWTQDYHWYFNADTTPGELTIAEAEQAIREATGNITNGRNDCSNRFGLEAVMTHERGHTFGLGHVAAGSPLTMRPGIAPCDGSAATLGLGDVRGLRQRY
ncbi:hypothetical protein F0U59_26140 [Archangium gephyra]|nr:hypothetical protein F0U59_26140 [Archangium gephyra]